MALPLGVSTSITGILAGVFIHQTGRYRELIWVGTVILTLGIGLLIELSPSSSLGEIIPFQIVAGIGSGLLFQAPLIAAPEFGISRRHSDGDCNIFVHPQPSNFLVYRYWRSRIPELYAVVWTPSNGIWSVGESHRGIVRKGGGSYVMWH